MSAGAREVYLIDEPMAAAIGADLPIVDPTGSMVLDIGGGTTEVGVISLGGIVYAHTLRMAGDKMDEAIIGYIRRTYGLLIGEATAERIKREIGTAWHQSEVRQMQIKGRHIADGVPRSQEIDSREVHNALSECLVSIVAAIKTALEKTPPELGADVAEKGIVVTGGGALLHDIDRMLGAETGLPIIITDEPLTTVVRGCGRALEEAETLGDVFLHE
jgi:rod shape-determining protein MreB